MTGTHARIPDERIKAGLENLLLRRNSVARDRWRKWQSGAPYPRDLYPDEPARLSWEPVPPGQRSHDHEYFLQQRIQNDLLRNGWRKHDANRDDFDLPESNLLRLSAGQKRYPDIVLVHKSRAKRLLIIEVKKDAVPRPGRSGIDQLDEYGPAMRRRARGWMIERWLVAKTIHPMVEAQARARHIDCYEWAGRPPRLRPLH